MSFQKCPKCNGTGIDPGPGVFNTPFPKCPVCKGEMIISKGTGKPPSVDISVMIDKYWRFDEDQQPLSSWHEKQDLIEILKQ